MAQLTLLQLTDTHLYAQADERLAGVDTRASFEAVLEQALRHQVPDLLLLTGDLAQAPSTATYALVEEIVASRYRGEVIYLPGNHDDPQFAPELFAERVFVAEGWRVIGLNSRIPTAEGGRIEGAELDWLQAQLDSAQEANILIAVHHPPLELGHCLDHGRIENGPQLLARLALDDRVRGLIHGHVHQAAASQIGALQLLATPSTSVQFKPLCEKFALDSKPPGCRWLHLASDGSIETRIERLPPGAFPATLAPV